MTLNNKVRFRITAALYIIAYFSLTSLTPLAGAFVLFQIFVSAIGIIQFLMHFKALPNIMRFFLIVFFLTFIISIYSAHVSLGQSIFDGIVANQNFLFAFGVIPFYRIIKKDMSYLFLFEDVLKKFMWLNVIALAIVSVGSFHYAINVSNGQTLTLQANKFPRMLVEFGTVYYFFKSVKLRKSIYLIYSLFFLFVFQIYNIERAPLLATFLAFFVVILFTINTRYSLSIFISTMFVFGTILFLLSYSDVLSKITSKFNQVLNFFTDQSAITEAGVRVRISEVATAMAGFLKRPIFGNGMPRPVNTTTLLNGSYFFVADIGIIGMLYANGIFGIVVFFIQGFTVMKVLIRERLRTSSILFGGSITYLFYLFLKSIPDAIYMLFPNNYFFVFVIILVLDSQIKRNRSLFVSGEFLYNLKSSKYKRWVKESLNFY